MKLKNIYSLTALIVFSITFSAQVGISTSSPQATLDAAGNATSTTTKDGVIAPRLTKQQLAAKNAGTYAAAQTGAIVYVTDTTTPTGTTPSLAQTTEITAIGYFFFNGIIWKNMNSGASNIYNSDGNLAGNRTVTQAGNTLAFSGTAVNAFSVDGTTFSVDASNDRVGVGTVSPTNKLHINATDPLRLQGMSTAGNTDNILAADVNGVVKTLGSLDALAIPAPAVLVLRTAQTNFLQAAGGGGTQRLPLEVGRNNIPGLGYDATTSTVTFPNGVYQITFVYEATHNNTSCTLSSYFMDFPGIHARRIHSTAAHNQGGSSNHGGTITFAALFDGTSSNNWVINLGRGVSGNCSGTGMTLTDYATQVLIFKLGN